MTRGAVYSKTRTQHHRMVGKNDLANFQNSPHYLFGHLGHHRRSPGTGGLSGDLRKSSPKQMFPEALPGT